MQYCFLFFTLTAAAWQEGRDLLEKLGSESVEERAAAAEALRKIGEPALDLLRKAQFHPDAETRGRIRDLIAELEWGPVLPLWFHRQYPRGLTVLRSGDSKEKVALVRELFNDDLLPPVLAERIVLHDPDAEARVAAAQALFSLSRPCYREAYFRLLEDPQAMRTFDQRVHRVSLGNLFYPTEERLLEAVSKVVDRSDAGRLARLRTRADPDRAGIADLLVGATGKEPLRERLVEIANSCAYPVAALARKHLVRHFGVEALHGLSAPSGTFASWHFEEAKIQGLLESGTPEALRELERHARNLGAGSSGRAFWLVARAGTGAVAGALLDHASRNPQGYAGQAVWAMPPEAILDSLKAGRQTDPTRLEKFARLILRRGDERLIEALLRLAGPEPSGLRYHRLAARPEVTAVCRRILEKPAEGWAVRFAYRQLEKVDPNGLVARATACLKDPAQPAFLEAVGHFSLLPEADRKQLLPFLTRKLEGATDVETVMAFGRGMQREWVHPMRRLTRSADEQMRSVALHALASASVLAPTEVVELALEHEDSVALWTRLRGQVPPEFFDRIRERVAASRAPAAISLAQALVASGDTRPFARMKEISNVKQPAYTYGMAAVRILTEGRACVRDLMNVVPRSLPHDAGQAGEIIRSVSAFDISEVEAFLLEQLANGPLPRGKGLSVVTPHSPFGPPAEAICGLVNLRSEKYRAMGLRVARLEERGDTLTRSWKAAVEALGTLGVEGALDHVVAWLEDAKRAARFELVEGSYLKALGYLGDERHVGLARFFLRGESTRSFAAVTLDRLVHRQSYRPLRRVRTLRGIDGDVRACVRFLADQWGLEVRLPEGEPEFRPWPCPSLFPVWRADGLQVLDALSELIGSVPQWVDGRVDFMSVDDAAHLWAWRR